MITARDIKSFVFVINEVKRISLRRSFTAIIEKCNSILSEIEKISNELTNKKFTEFEYELFTVIDELKFVIEIENRFVLFPLPDIKKDAYEIGKSYMKNFLEWMNFENNSDDAVHYSPEKLMEILEDDSYRLDEMRELLEKLHPPVSN